MPGQQPKHFMHMLEYSHENLLQIGWKTTVATDVKNIIFTSPIWQVPCDVVHSSTEGCVDMTTTSEI